MKVSIVIPTCNRPESLRRAVKSMREQTVAAYEIIVSHDDAGRRGAAATRNRGARKTSGEIIIFMDDDCIAAPDCVEKIIEAFADLSVVGACGSVHYDGQKTRDDRIVSNPHARWFIGAICAVRRETFFAVGGFPIEFRAYEDKALALKLAGVGKIAHIAATRVFHERSLWTAATRRAHEDHLIYWSRLAEKYDVWADLQDPPPILWRHILLVRDFGAITKNFWNAKGRMLFRQRLALWRHSAKRLIRTKQFDVSILI